MRRYLFADEAGDFHFKNTRGASKYFILCTITCDSPDCGLGLLSIRRRLAWEHGIDSVLHAATDTQIVRDTVFEYIKTLSIRIDATILEIQSPAIHKADRRTFLSIRLVLSLQIRSTKDMFGS